MILVSNQIFSIVAIKFDPSLVDYKETSDWRKHKTILEERIACLEICNECFNDVIYDYFYILIIFNIILNII